MALYALPGPTILAGQSLSEGVDCTGSRIVRIMTPPAWSGNAPLTFLMSPDGVTYGDVYHIEEVTHGPPARYAPYELCVPGLPLGAVIVMPAGTGDGVAWVRFRSGTTHLPIAQEADRAFQLILLVPDAARVAA